VRPAPILSEGARLLRIVRDASDERLLLKQLAGGICSVPYIAQLLDGTRTPSLEMAVRIKKQYGIPCEAWLERARAVLQDAETPDGTIAGAESKRGFRVGRSAHAVVVA
jgi:plasmid maintenance system antidote protein VapI